MESHLAARRRVAGLAGAVARGHDPASPTGRPWLACLLRIGSNGEVGADFEYDDAERWAINPRNLAQRIAEFAAMPV